jgi:hypothetical protein
VMRSAQHLDAFDRTECGVAIEDDAAKTHADPVGGGAKWSRVSGAFLISIGERVGTSLARHQIGTSREGLTRAVARH